MTDPNSNPSGQPPRPAEPKPTTDEATIQAEDLREDAEDAREAIDEALREGAVPWQRAKREVEPDPS